MRELNEILSYAADKKSSDIHFTIGRPIMIRERGELVPLDDEKLSAEMIKTLVLPILTDRAKADLEKYGDCDFAYSIPGKGRYRVNVYKQRGSLSAALRILPVEIPNYKDLNIPASAMNMVDKKKGLVLVTGATGSGKSTTLATLINAINEKYPKHIITLEDPIEYLHKHLKSSVDQREIGEDASSYSHALRAALREDPDVILVGEMRDLETISTAITAAETGHLVLSTLHTNSAATTLDRLVDVFPAEQQQQIRIQLANVIECIVSQQLIPRSDGRGRIAAFEVMLANNAIRNLIRENKSYQIPSTILTSKKNGMQIMDDAIYDLFIMGHIDEENCIAFAHDQAKMSSKVII